MTPDQIITQLKIAAGFLRFAASGLGFPALLTAAEALEQLAANEQLITTVFSGVSTLVDLFKAIVGWLDKSGHTVAATYLNTMRPN